MTRHSYSLRQRLNLIAGSLLVFIALGACVALGLAQRQLRDAQLVSLLHEQARGTVELVHAGDRLLQYARPGAPLEPQRLETFRQQLNRLTRNLRVLRDGGSLDLEEGRTLRIQAVREPTLAVLVEQALAAAARYRQQIDAAVSPEAGFNAALRGALRLDMERYGQSLQAAIDGLAAMTEGRSLTVVVQTGRVYLALIVGGLCCFLIGVVLLRRFITTPLHRMADGIDAMRRSGRLVKLPVLHRNELGLVAEGFNQLAEQTETQKRRLREHIVELQRMNIELDQLANLKDDFLATINHQLRTPLTSLLEGVQLFGDGALGPLSADQAEFIRTMQGNGQQLLKLIEELLDLSLLRSGRRLLQRQPTDFAALLQQLEAAWQAAGNTRTVRLNVEQLPQVYLDAQAIREVLDQLIRNALRHAPEHSVVTVKASVHDRLVSVAVHNRGAGLSQEQLARMFEPFVHLHTPEAPGSEGSGLGLSFCRQVVERHRGTIQATSTPDHGTTVTFTLPIATATFLLEEACQAAQEEAKDEGGSFGILVIVPLASSPKRREEMRQAQALLRRHTHRGDQFIEADDETVVIVAVTDWAGLEAMRHRLAGVLRGAQLDVRLGPALFPADGEQPIDLVRTAKHRAAEPAHPVIQQLTPRRHVLEYTKES